MYIYHHPEVDSIWDVQSYSHFCEGVLKSTSSITLSPAAYMHTCIYTYVRTCLHRCPHTCLATYLHACLHTSGSSCSRDFRRRPMGRMSRTCRSCRATWSSRSTGRKSCFGKRLDRISSCTRERMGPRSREPCWFSEDASSEERARSESMPDEDQSGLVVRCAGKPVGIPAERYYHSHGQLQLRGSSC